MTPEIVVESNSEVRLQSDSVSQDMMKNESTIEAKENDVSEPKNEDYSEDNSTISENSSISSHSEKSTSQNSISKKSTTEKSVTQQSNTESDHSEILVPPKKSNFDFLDSSSETDHSMKKEDDIFDFLNDGGSKKDENTILRIEETISKIDSTNLDFLNSDEFKPMSQKKSFSFLESSEDEGKVEASDKSSISEKSEESESPFMKNLKAAQRAKERSRGQSESSIASEYSDTENQSESKIYDNSELNGLSDDELERVKEKMDRNFSKRQLKPGDSEFVYDKQVEFEPNQECDWDDSYAA